MEEVAYGYPQYTKTILSTPAEIDGRSLLEILGRAGHFRNVEAVVNDLREHLIVKYKKGFHFR